MRVRIEVINDEGEKSSLDIEGNLSKSVVIDKLINFLNAEFSHFSPETRGYGDELTLKERLTYFLKYEDKAPKGWFTSSELKRIYEEVYNEEIKLSTISTYLAKMHLEGILERRGSKARREYRLVTKGAKKEQEHAKALLFSS
ncbi:MAG: hypothetical protein ACXQTS_00315 [Candidatus Methanospirareceae archaeon]